MHRARVVQVALAAAVGHRRLLATGDELHSRDATERGAEGDGILVNAVISVVVPVE